jgi:hypothetical protein
MRPISIALSLSLLGFASAVLAEPPAGERGSQDVAPVHARDAGGPSPSGDSNTARMSRDDAVTRAYRSLELKVERNRDGSFSYNGRGVSARIDAQGGLTMRDQFHRAKFVFDPQQIDDKTWITWFFRLKFDLFAKIDKAFGNDSYRSERHEFLEQTRELRELLLERYSEQALERTLEGTWKLAMMSVSEKKERFFSLWSECSDDQHGLYARRRIEAFVREHCPRDSACEYGEQELIRLNRKNAAKDRFAPYDPIL